MISYNGGASATPDHMQMCNILRVPLHFLLLTRNIVLAPFFMA